MRIAIARETRDGEARVAMVPELVEKLTRFGYEVAVEPGAGHHALITDAEYIEAGALVDAGAFDGADLVVSVQPLDLTRARGLAPGTSTISFLPTNAEAELVTAYRDGGITSYAMELVPRISRAQSMDALSSQALVDKRRWAIVIAFVVAAILTPPDPLSQIGLALPTIILYEVAIWTARMIEKSQQREKLAREKQEADAATGAQSAEASSDSAQQS